MKKLAVVLAILVSISSLLGVLLSSGSGVSAQVTSTADLQSTHRTTLQRWLQSKPGLRLALEQDCRNTEGLKATRAEYGRNYQPYYAVGDFNRDGQTDFAVALLDSRKPSRNFAIAIFNAPFNQNRLASPAFYTAGIDLSEGGLILSGNRLLAGVFQSDDCVILRPRGRTYSLKSCL